MNPENRLLKHCCAWGNGGKSQALALAYLNLRCPATLRSYPFARATAMNLVASAVLTCISTLCLPLALAWTTAERTSSTVATALPPIFRMTSPVFRPCSAAGPLGSTDVTTRPFCPTPSTPLRRLAGARLRPRHCGPALAFDGSPPPCGSVLDERGHNSVMPLSRSSLLA